MITALAIWLVVGLALIVGAVIYHITENMQLVAEVEFILLMVSLGVIRSVDCDDASYLT
jgi:hypothetical protein